MRRNKVQGPDRGTLNLFSVYLIKLAVMACMKSLKDSTTGLGVFFSSSGFNVSVLGSTVSLPISQ